MAEVEVRRTIRAPRERVFDAWTREESVRQWWPADGMKCGPIVLELQPGGRMEMGLIPAEGDPFSALGEFKAVERPSLLEFTWRWSSGMDVPETLVRVEFRETDDAAATEVVLTHTGFPTEEVAAQHEDGWTKCLDRLEPMF